MIYELGMNDFQAQMNCLSFLCSSSGLFGLQEADCCSLVMAHGTTLASKACVTRNEGTEI